MQHDDSCHDDDDDHDDSCHDNDDDDDILWWSVCMSVCLYVTKKLTPCVFSEFVSSDI